jgi:exopolyphosphatase/guanosine-5'-triphosphate,3'-diphosphate pyrophosphatase
MAKLGILDIGTNSIHMVLAEVEPDGSYKILDRFKDMTRLGDGVFKTGRLSDDAMKRALEVIRTLVTLARNKGHDRIRAVATSAVREAKNGGEFIQEIARHIRLRVRVVTGLEEARLIYLGVRRSIDLSGLPTLVVDVGGGSVELIVGNRESMLHGQSLKLGAIRLKDQFLKHDPPTKGMLRDLQHAVDQPLKAVFQQFRTKRFERLVATSGMAANLTDIIYLHRTGRPVPQLNMATITFKELEAIESLLKRSSLKERLAIPGLDPKRADTLLPAAVVLRSVMDLTEFRELTLSDKGIRDGVIFDFIEKHREGIRAEQEIPNVRRRNVIYLARRCHYPEAHSRHVANLAIRLFDETVSLHGLGDREREWLEYAALLHDIGYMINSRQHHKHTHYLITHSELNGLAVDEIEMIANIARYHRRALPHKSHPPVKALPGKRRKVLDTLSALLRIADGLDRSQFGVVKDLRVKLGRPVMVELDTIGDAELELWAARGRTDLFEKVFKRPLEFRMIPTFNGTAGGAV